jgi:two-component system OmpR family response regulator
MRILVVEDERKIAEFVKKGLKAEGYAVDTAADGEEGRFLAATGDYDLVLLDLRLPKMDGITLCRTLRAEKYAGPILMLTARDTVKDKVLGLDSGADDYLTKPFDFEELLARVRALLRKRGAAEPTRLQVDDLVMDLLAHTVERGSRLIALTPKEFSLLEYLLRNAGTVVSRAMIAEHVWDIHFDSFTNVIDVSVNHLRSKVDRDFPKKLIQTVRGRGYVLKG